MWEDVCPLWGKMEETTWSLGRCVGVKQVDVQLRVIFSLTQTMFYSHSPEPGVSPTIFYMLAAYFCMCCSGVSAVFLSISHFLNAMNMILNCFYLSICMCCHGFSLSMYFLSFIFLFLCLLLPYGL